MRDWVRNDLAGKGATRRMMLRVAVPAVVVLAPFWLIPTTLDVHLSMTLPILIPFVYFSHALNKVWRRHMLQVHNLDPDLVDERARKRDAHIHQAYVERYGPRPEARRRPPRRRRASLNYRCGTPPSSSKACAQPTKRSVASTSSAR